MRYSFGTFVFHNGKEPVVDRECTPFVQSKVMASAGISATFNSTQRVFVAQKPSKFADKLTSAFEPLEVAR
jgi:hypothetical protein